MDSRNALATCYWMFFPTPRSRAFFHAYSPMQTNVYVHFIHYEHTFGPGISSRSRAGCRSMHQADPMETLFSICTHISFLLVVDHVVVVLVFDFFLATCAAGRPLVVHPFLTAGGPKRVARDHNGDCIFFHGGVVFFLCRGLIFV